MSGTLLLWIVASVAMWPESFRCCRWKTELFFANDLTLWNDLLQTRTLTWFNAVWRISFSLQWNDVSRNLNQLHRFCIWMKPRTWNYWSYGLQQILTNGRCRAMQVFVPQTGLETVTPDWFWEDSLAYSNNDDEQTTRATFCGLVTYEKVFGTKQR